MKRVVIAFMVTCMLGLTGCAKVENIANSYLSNQIKDEIIDDNPSYLAALEQEQTIHKDSDGYYFNELDNQPPVDMSGSTRVFFGNNGLLNITYYIDEAKTQIIDPNQCYLNPGDTIYHMEFKNENPLFVFDGFSIYDAATFINDSQIDRKLLQRFSADDNIVIPDGAPEAVYIEPVGAYKYGTIALNDYYEDVNGNRVNLSSSWIVGDNITKDSVASVSSEKPIIIYCDYSSFSDEYYFAESNNEVFQDREGVLEFKRFSLLSDSESFNVRFKPYIHIGIKEDKTLLSWADALFGKNIIKSIAIGNDELELSDANAVRSRLDHIKPGNTLYVTVDNKYSVSLNPIKGESAAIGSTTQYTFTIPDTKQNSLSLHIKSIDTASSSAFSPKIVDNAAILLFPVDSAAHYDDGDIIDSDAKVRLAIEPYEGYYVSNSKTDSYETTMTYNEYVDEIDAIIEEHPIRRIHKVVFDDNAENGKVVFTDRGKNILLGEVEIKAGEEVKITFTITDSKYKFAGDKKDIFGRYDTTKTVKYIIPDDLNKMKIKAEDFIELERK